jgi:3-isopropylmalate dehydrogenase
MKEADAIDKAVMDVLNAGYRTGDIFNKEKDDPAKKVGTKEMGALVVAALK